MQLTHTLAKSERPRQNNKIIEKYFINGLNDERIENVIVIVAAASDAAAVVVVVIRKMPPE